MLIRVQYFYLNTYLAKILSVTDIAVILDI